MNMKQGTHRMPAVLIVAGSDSIGGAGIQADIKTCTALCTYAMTAITAITAQNTMGVQSYEAVGDTMLQAQLDAIIADVRPDAVKIGMLPTVQCVHTVAAFIRRHGLTNVVVDPVCVATSGDALAEGSVPAAIRDVLMPLADVVTPNIPEAALLSGLTVNAANTPRVLQRLHDSGAKAVLLKGGHAAEAGHTVDDILSARGTTVTLSGRFIETRNTHGTGCTLSSAIAANLALGHPLEVAVANAKEYVTEAIAAGAIFDNWHGNGSLCHYHNIKKQ